MPLDPFGEYDPLANLRQLQKPQAGSSFPALSPADEESVLGHLGRQALSGIGFAAQTLGKPGRAVRGLLGGQGGSALLNLLPFSDTLGITDPANDVSGRDLLHKAGLTDAPQKGFEWSDIPGFALELATDPLMYLNPLAPLGGGALTASGKAAQKAGTLAPRLAERVAQGQAGLMGVGIPGVAHGAIGTGPVAQKVAEGLGSSYDKVANSGLGRGMASLFNKGVANTRSLLAQTGMLGAQEAVPGIEAPLRAQVYDALKPLMDEGALNPTERQQSYDSLAQIVQGQASPLKSPLGDLFKDASSKISGLMGSVHGAETGLGKDVGLIKNYLPREWAPLERPTPGYLQPRNPISPGIKSDIGREEIFDLPTGQHGVDALAMDPKVSGPNRFDSRLGRAPTSLEAKSHIFEQHLGESEKELGALQTKNNFSRGLMTQAETDRLAELLGKEKQASQLADWAKTLDPRHAAENIPFFSRDLPKVLLNRIEGSAQSQARMGAFHDIISQVARPAQLPTDVPLSKVYEQFNMAQGGNLNQGTVASLTPKLGGITGTFGNSLQGKMYVPKEIADDLARSIQGWRTPEGMQPLANVWDAATNLFRMGTTNALLNPSRVLRNFGQDVVMGAEQGANPLAKMGLAKAALREGATTPEAQALQREAFIHKVTGPGINTRNFEVGAVPGQMPLPGDARPGLGSIIKGAVPKNLQEANPLNIAGVGGRTEAGFAPARATQQLDEHFSDLSRGGAFAKLIQDGWAPEAAAKHVNRALYDYGNMSDFERNVMRRVAPFYSWTRQNVPGVLKNLAENPAGLSGVGLRAAGDVRQKEGFLPPFLADTLAMPIGERTPEGNQRFLSTLGLPFEDAFSDMGVGHGTVTGNVEHTLSKLMSHANPIIKGALELATGKQFESGRELSDLSSKGLTGNTLADQALMNSPLSKGLTDARTLMDERKGLGSKLGNLLSPVKLKDIDMNSQREIEARNMVEDYLKQNPNIKSFQRLYVPNDQRKDLKPADVQAMRLETSLIERQEEASLERQAKAGDTNTAHKLQLLKAKRGGR